ncbi:c-type cytochrome [Psychrobacter sp. I-STPA6b]|uniref:c-type cytochrome n=1 Tax=Psychrobacter sp. I-STPA6b TaxID=2585718 RepID=UPI001D0CBC2D|nr:cytochrome c [Psychrobacter sp. I-STPA6b]
MKIKPTLLATVLLPLSLMLSACSNTGSGSNESVKARQDIMSNWGDAMQVMGGMVKNPDTFDAQKFQEEAAFMAEDASKPWQHFQDENAKGGSTDAVWSDRTGFEAEAQKFEQATAQLNADAQNATSVADIESAFKEVGASCKSCHTTYKQPN